VEAVEDEEPMDNTAHHRTEQSVDVLQKVREAVESTGVKAGPPGDELKWLNFTVAEIWPFVDKSVGKIIKETVEPAIQAAMPTPLKGTHFKEQLSLGSAPPKLGPIQVARKFDQNHPGVELAIGVKWDCNAKIELSVLPGVTIGIKRLSIEGEVYLILRPLMESVPIVGGLQITMVAPPSISWELTGLAQVVQFPKIASTLKGVLQQVLTDLLVLPNRVFVHWVWGREREIDISSMQYPRPEAVVRLGVVEAKGLQGKDWNLFGKATSDPYVRIQVGHRKHTTQAIQKTLEPHWGENGWYDFLMYTPKQHLDIQLFDSDLAVLGAGDDTLGEMYVFDEQSETMRKANLCDVLTKPDSWWKIYEKRGGGRTKVNYEECGEIKVQVEVFSLRSDAVLFNAARKDVPTKHGEAKCDGLLSVQLRGLRGLPKKLAKGAKIVCRCSMPGGGGEMETVVEESIKSKYVEQVMDKDAVDVDPAIQRMVEFLYIDGKKTKTITEVSGLTEQQVLRILEMRPSFHTKWNQSLHIPVLTPQEAEIQLRLVVPGESESAAHIELAKGPFKLKDLFAKQDLRFEDLVKMDRVAGPKGIVHGPFELDIAMQLFGLVPTDLRKLLPPES